MSPSRNGHGKESRPDRSVKEEQKAFEREHERNIEELDAAIEKLDEVVERQTSSKRGKTPA